MSRRCRWWRRRRRASQTSHSVSGHNLHSQNQSAANIHMCEYVLVFEPFRFFSTNHSMNLTQINTVDHINNLFPSAGCWIVQKEKQRSINGLTTASLKQPPDGGGNCLSQHSGKCNLALTTWWTRTSPVEILKKSKLTCFWSTAAQLTVTMVWDFKGYFRCIFVYTKHLLGKFKYVQHLEKGLPLIFQHQMRARAWIIMFPFRSVFLCLSGSGSRGQLSLLHRNTQEFLG